MQLASDTFTNRRTVSPGLPAIVALITAALAAACSPSNANDAGADVVRDVATDVPAACMPAGGAVTGAMDTHCTGDAGMIVQATSQASCHPDAGATDAGSDDGGDMTPDYGDTMFNSASFDDDCKYHVAWTSTPVCESTDVTFTVTATLSSDSTTPVRGAAIIAEVFLSDTHPAPNTDQTVTETSPGVYTVGPVRFDASGMWTVRFHLFEDCADLFDDSPHGHAAFYVNVP